MARSKISSTTKSAVNDDGSIIFPIVDGEQLHIEFALGWLTDLTGYNIHAKIVEALNDGTGSKPTSAKPGGVRKLLTIDSGYIRNIVAGSNKFTLVLPWNLSEGFEPRPAPDAPVFAYIDIEVGEPGTGDPEAPVGDPATPDKQVWKPIRGLVSIDYSPTETI